MAALYQGSQRRQAAAVSIIPVPAYLPDTGRQPDDHLALRFRRLTKQSDDSDECTKTTSLAGLGWVQPRKTPRPQPHYCPTARVRHSVQSAANKGYPQA
jgi:hypothetical protein